MSATVELIGADELARRVADWPRDIHEAVTTQVRREVEPLMAHMRGRAAGYGRMATLAASTVRMATVPSGLTVTAGGRGNLASTLLYGAEYGGRKRGKRPYVNRSRSGNGYIMRRRATMQFKPHLGSRGYWYWATAREDLKGINARVRAVIYKAVQ